MRVINFLACSVFLFAMGACAPKPEPVETVTPVQQLDVKDVMLNTIMKRRSIRAYKDTPVEHAKLEIIAQCGINAPNGMNAQPWEVRIVENKQWIDGITAEYLKKNKDAAAQDPNFKNMFRNAPNLIVIATANGQSQIDAGLLAENMILMAQSMDLGTCCLGGPVAFVAKDPSAKPYLDRLEIPDGYEIVLLIAIGYPDESPAPKLRDASKIKFIN